MVMKIYDCFMFYDEDMLLDIRLNILDKYVDYFVIVESRYFHNGKNRELKFNLKNYEKFKNKIIYIVQDNEPEGIIKLKDSDDENTKTFKLVNNSYLREHSQRNTIIKGLKDAKEDDLILISDVDEIPNLELLEIHKINRQIIIFEQVIFYYKFNRYLNNFTWFGTKGCKKKYMKSPQWIRNVKNKRFYFWRLDTLFSNTKYINKHFVKNGGWHFSNIKKTKDIELKLKSYLHHRDYENEELGLKKIDEIIKRNETIYDMFGDKTSKKFGDNQRKKLEKYNMNKLPKYIIRNSEKFKDWLD